MLHGADLEHLSRREFLKWSRNGFLGLFALPFLNPLQRFERLNQPLLEGKPQLGRVLDNHTEVFDKPSFGAELKRVYWRDLVFPIDEVTIGDEKPLYNRTWYHMNGEGYVHSGKVQPVELLTQSPPTVALPESGQLAEVSVPYTDVVKDVERPERIEYRFYYGTTYWVTAVKSDSSGKQWYRVWDDKYKQHLFAHCEHLRLLPAEELAPLLPGAAADTRRVEVWLAHQVVIAYQDDEPVLITKTATGGKFIDGDYTTPYGFYITNRKRPTRHMAAGDMAAPNSYDLPGVPWVCYLTEKGISFHGTYWHNDFGRPRSHGCINLSIPAARWIYRWSMPTVPYNKDTWADDFGSLVHVID
jgi:hypothetical protein